MAGAGCGSPGPSGPSGSSVDASGSAVGASGAPAGTSSASGAGAPTAYLPQPEPELTVPAGGTGPIERLTGVIGAGVESGCRLLAIGGGRGVQLLGGDARLRVGATVTVEGRRAPGLATTCQEGTPFVVTAVLAATPTATP